MKQVKSFDRATAQNVHKLVAEAVRKAVEALGLHVTDTGSFRPEELSLRFKLAALAGGTAADLGIQRLADAGYTARQFNYGGKSYTAIDYVAKRREYPITAKRDSDGKEFRFPASVLEGAIRFPTAAKDAVGEIYEPLPRPEVGVEWNKIAAVYDQNWKRLEAIDQKAKANGQLLYRYITHGFADGHAVYQIVAVKGNRATIRVVSGIGDDWVPPAWGQQTSISLAKAEDFVRRRDSLAELFSQKAS